LPLCAAAISRPSCSGTSCASRQTFETSSSLYRLKGWNQALSRYGSTGFNLYSPTKLGLRRRKVEVHGVVAQVEFERHVLKPGLIFKGEGLKPVAFKLWVNRVQRAPPHHGDGGSRSLSQQPSGRVGTPGCQIGYTDNTGCHQFVFVTIRPTRVVTPGCQIGYVGHTGCRQLVF
jgi:hypothetical protein